jgi:hypothetical protein
MRTFSHNYVRTRRALMQYSIIIFFSQYYDNPMLLFGL